jgi:hypothetical protein
MATKTKEVEIHQSVVIERYNEQGAKLKELLDGGLDLRKAARKMGMSIGKAIRLNAWVNVKPSERITGTDKEVGKEIARLRDVEGVPWSPEIWARSGLGLTRMHELYEAASGKGWKESGIKKAPKPKAAAKPKKAPKPKAAAKRTTKKEAPKAEVGGRNTRVKKPSAA